MTGLRGKVVVVTGAARGTGRVHCQRFADEGADVIALDAAAVADDLRDTAREVEKRGRRCATGLADVSLWMSPTPRCSWPPTRRGTSPR